MVENIFAMAPSGAEGAGGGAGFISFLPIILIFFIIYFLMIRPQVKRQKEMKIMLEGLKKGDKVITNGGIVGVIAGIKEKENIIILKVDQNVKIELVKASISKILERETQ